MKILFFKAIQKDLQRLYATSSIENDNEFYWQCTLAVAVRYRATLVCSPMGLHPDYFGNYWQAIGLENKMLLGIQIPKERRQQGKIDIHPLFNNHIGGLLVVLEYSVSTQLNINMDLEGCALGFVNHAVTPSK